MAENIRSEAQSQMQSQISATLQMLTSTIFDLENRTRIKLLTIICC